MEVVTGEELVEKRPKRSPLAPAYRRTGELDKDLGITTEVANDAMERLIAGAAPARPEAWRKAWQIIAGRAITVAALQRIMDDVVASSMPENEDVRDRRKAQAMVLDAIDKLSADEASYAKGSGPVLIQINMEERPHDYLRIQGE